MLTISTGSDLQNARQRLDLTQETLAQVLGISTSTLNRHERAREIEPWLALAVECLLRREAMKRTPRTPEERAKARLEERRLYKQMVAEAGLGPKSGAVRTPEEVAARQVAIAAERRRLQAEGGAAASRAVQAIAYKEERRRLGLAHARNRERNKERPLILALQRKLLPLAATATQSGDWSAYVRAVDLACAALGADPATYRSAYLEAARQRVIADEDPLVTLPLEAEHE